MRMKHLESAFMGMERVIKSGLLNVTLRDQTDLEVLKEGEIFVDYSVDPLRPVLKVIRDGLPVFLYTESDRLYREFLENVLQVGTDPDSNTYKPSMYFKVNVDSDGSEGFTPENIKYFYNKFKTNTAIKPYLGAVRNSQGDNYLYPFMDTNHVYFDMTEILESSEQDIRTVSDVLTEIWNHVGILHDSLKASLDNIKAVLDDAIEDFQSIEDIQDDMLSTLNDANNANLDNIKHLQEELDALADSAEWAIRPMDFTLTHPDGEDVVIPVLFTLSGGRNIIGDVRELFKSELFISDKNVNQIARIGTELMLENAELGNAAKDLEWSTRRIGNTTYLYEVEQVSGNSFLVMLRVGEYTVSHKYIESVTIEPMLSGHSGFSVSPLTVVFNELINGEGFEGPMTRSFSTIDNVSNKLVLGNSYSIRIEEGRLNG